MTYDLIIAGAGPAGMTSAVYSARKGLNTLLISKDIGGQALWTSGIENYMGYQYIEGAELMKKFQDQMQQFPIERRIGVSLSSMAKLNAGFEVATDLGGKYQARAVILAMGKRPKELDVPGEQRLRGRGVSYCAICDGPLFSGDKVAVVGGGNSALEAADNLVKIAEHTYLITRDSFTGDQILIDRVTKAPNLTTLAGYEVLEIEGKNRVQRVKIRHIKTHEEKLIEIEGLFVEIGLVPNSQAVRNLVQQNELGEIIVNCCCETGTPGLFAAGDITNVTEKQIVIAAGEGAKAAIQAHKYLQRL